MVKAESTIHAIDPAYYTLAAGLPRIDRKAARQTKMKDGPLGMSYS